MNAANLIALCVADLARGDLDTEQQQALAWKMMQALPDLRRMVCDRDEVVEAARPGGVVVRFERRRA